MEILTVEIFILVDKMQRPVFERSIIEGLRTPRTESIAMATAGKRLFAGSNDGSLWLYECRLDAGGSKFSFAWTVIVMDCIR